MTKKLFIATLELELAVEAENEEEAAQIAYANYSNEVISHHDFYISEATYMPGGYDAGAEPYVKTGATPSKTVGEWVKEQGAAWRKELEEIRAETRAAQIPPEPPPPTPDDATDP